MIRSHRCTEPVLPLIAIETKYDKTPCNFRRKRYSHDHGTPKLSSALQQDLEASVNHGSRESNLDFTDNQNPPTHNFVNQAGQQFPAEVDSVIFDPKSFDWRRSGNFTTHASGSENGLEENQFAQWNAEDEEDDENRAMGYKDMEGNDQDHPDDGNGEGAGDGDEGEEKREGEEEPSDGDDASVNTYGSPKNDPAKELQDLPHNIDSDSIYIRVTYNFSSDTESRFTSQN